MLMQVDNTTDDTHVIDWEIRNFSMSILDVGERLKCPIITAGNLYNTRWELVIYPKGKINYPNYLCCFLRRDGKEEVGPERLHVGFELSLVTFDGVQLFKKIDNKEFKRGSSFGYFKFVKLEEIFCRREFLLPRDELTIRCKLKLLPPKKKQPSHHIFTTKSYVEEYRGQMTLKKFRSLTKQNPQVFRVRGTKESLSLYVSLNKDEISVDQDAEREQPSPLESYLHIVMEKKKSEDIIFVSCWINLLNTKSEIAMDKMFGHLFSDVDQEETWILPYFIDTNNLGDNIVENDSLNLELNFTVCNEQPQTLLTADLTPLKLAEDPKETTLLKDLAYLHETNKFSDVTLHIGDQTFPAHKSFLAVRCPRFRRIFASLMRENPNCGNHIVEINDVDKDTMAKMLKFIYTDSLDEMNDESCLLLYSAAQKYKIPSLQLKCARILGKSLSVTNFYKVLLTAEEFEDSELKMVVLDYILANYQSILRAPEWQIFTEKDAELAAQVMRHIQIKEKMPCQSSAFIESKNEFRNQPSGQRRIFGMMFEGDSFREAR